MVKVKNIMLTLVFILVILGVILLGQIYIINHNNFYAIEAGSVSEANEGLLDMDISGGRSFSTMDFYGEYVPGTSFVISKDDRVYYDQGYYIVYKDTYEPVYCINPLKTAWSVLNKDSLDEVNSHEFSTLSLETQNYVSNLAKVTQSKYDETNEPMYLVAGQLLVWEAVGSTLESYTDNLQIYMDEIESEAMNYTKDSTEIEGINYYDTSGQDLIGVTDPSIDSESEEISIEKSSDVVKNSTLENGQSVTYKIVVSNPNDESKDVLIQDELNDANLSYVLEDNIIINGQDSDLTIGDLKEGILVNNLSGHDSMTIEYKVTLDLSNYYENGDSIINSANVCINKTEICDDDIETIGGDEDLSVEGEKVIKDSNGNDDGIAQEGEVLSFEISVLNSSNVPQTPTVKDELNDPNIVYDLTAPVYFNGVDSGYVVKDLGEDGVLLPELVAGEEMFVSFDAVASEQFVFADNENLLTNDSHICTSTSCTDVTGSIEVAGINLEKTVSDADDSGVADAGEVLTYTIQIENYAANSSSITVEDSMSNVYVNIDPDDTLLISPEHNTDPTDPTIGDLQKGITINNVDPGEVVTISYEVVVKDEFEIIGEDYHISNFVEACVDDSTCDDDTSSITVDPSNPVIDGGDSSIIKFIYEDSGDGLVQPGEQLTFDVMLTNGTDNEQIYMVKDPLEDVNIDYILTNPLEESVGSHGEFMIDSPTVGDLKTGFEIKVLPNSYFEFTFVANVKDPLEDPDVSDVYNSIKACTDEGCATGGNKVPVDSIVGFEVVKDVHDANGDGILKEGESFTYSISVINSGNEEADFILKDAIDTTNAEFDLTQKLIVSGDDIIMTPSEPVLQDIVIDAYSLVDSQYSEGIVIQGLEPQENVVFEFSGKGKDVMLEGDYTISNVAQVLWLDQDGNVVSDLDDANLFTDSDGGTLIEDIGVTKSSFDASNDGVVSPGEEVNYVINIYNSTSYEASVTVKDLFEDENIEYNMNDEFEFLATSPDSTISGSTLGDLKSGVDVVLTPNSSALISYKGVAKDPAVDPLAILDYNEIEYCYDSVCNSDISTINRESIGDFLISKTAYMNGSEVYEAVDGDVLTYEITVENIGNVDLKNIQVNDVIDDNLLYKPLDVLKVEDEDGNNVAVIPEKVAVGGFFKSGIVIKELKVGEKVIISFDVTVVNNKFKAENEYLTNIAQACDEEGTCKSDDATVTINPDEKPIDPSNPGNVYVVKNIIQDDPSDNIAIPGEELTFNIYVVNNGYVEQEVAIQDELTDKNIAYDDSTSLEITPNPYSYSYTVGDLRSGLIMNIPAKTTIKISFKANVKSGKDFDSTQSQITNLVTACYDDSEEDVCSEGGGHVPLEKMAGLYIKKDVLVNGVAQHTAELGDDLTYEISVENIMNTNLEDISFIDTYPEAFISVPTQDLVIYDEDGNILPTTPGSAKTDDLFEVPGVMVNNILEPGETIYFKYDSKLTSDVKESDVEHFTNVVATTSAKPDEVKKNLKNSSYGDKDNLIAWDSATITTNEDKPVAEEFSVKKSVVESIDDGVATPGEELTYHVLVTNLTSEIGTVKLKDYGDIYNNIDYSSSSLSVMPAKTVTNPTTPTTQDLFDGNLEVEVPGLESVDIYYTGVVKDPLVDPTASYLYNKVEACSIISPDLCDESGNLLPIIETAGFDINKDVQIVRAGSGDIDESIEPALEGDVLRYTITIQNNRNKLLEDVVVKDVIDSEITVDKSQSLSILDSAGNEVSVNPNNTIGQLMSGEGIVIDEIGSGDYVTISFESLPLSSDAVDVEYDHLSNIVKACSDYGSTKSQAQNTDEGLCGSDSATVTTDSNNPLKEGLAVIKNITDTDSSGVSDGIASPGDNLHFEIVLESSFSSEQVVNVVDDLDDVNIEYDLISPVKVTPTNVVTTPETPVVGDLMPDDSGVGLKVNMPASSVVYLEFDAKVSEPLQDLTAANVSNEVLACIDTDCTDGGDSLVLPNTKGFDVQKTVAINGVDADSTIPTSYVVAGGDNLLYTVTITNNRNTDLKDVVVEDTIDDDIIVDFDDSVNPLIIQSSDVNNPDHNNPDDKTVSQLFDGTLIIEEVKVGEVITLQYEAQVQDDISTVDNDEFANFVQACMANPLSRGQSQNVGEQLCGGDTVTITTDSEGILKPDEKIGIVKNIIQEDESDGIALPGEKLTFDIVLYNPYSSSVDVTLTDQLSDPNINYDHSADIVVNPSEYLISPKPAKVGDLISGINLSIPGESYVRVNFDANVASKIVDTSAKEVSNVAKVCTEVDCSDSSAHELLPENADFTITKVAYKDGEPVGNTVLSEGDKITYYVQMQNTGNVVIQNLLVRDIQDDNLVSDLDSRLKLVESETDQPGFSFMDTDPKLPKVGDLLVGSLGYSEGIIFPELDPAKKITFMYESVVEVVSDTELEATNMIQACVASEGSSMKIGESEFCNDDSETIYLKPHDDGDDNLDVLKFVIDDLEGTPNFIAQQDEKLTYFGIVKNKSNSAITVNLLDTPDSNVSFDLTEEVKVIKPEYLTSQSSITIGELQDPTNEVVFTIPGNSSMIVSYSGTLLNEADGLDMSAQYTSNTLDACKVEEDTCGHGEAHIDIEAKKLIDITKSVTTLNETDLDSDLVYDVVNGEKVSYKLNVKNLGNTSTDIVVKDDFPYEYLTIPDLTVNLVYPSIITTDPETPTVGDLLGDGVVFKNVQPGQEFDIVFDCYVKDDLTINGEEYSGYITNIGQACTVAKTRVEEMCSNGAVEIEYNGTEDPLIPGMDIKKEIIDENGDGIAAPGENITFRVNAVNSGDETATFVINDKFEDPNIDYSSSMEEDLVKIGGSGEFVGAHQVKDLKDDLGTIEKEGVEVEIPEDGNIEFTFTAKVYDPLKDDAKYNDYVTNIVSITNEDGDSNYAMGIIDLPVYNRMDVRKTYTTDYVKDVDHTLVGVDNVYYVTAPGDEVYYTIEYKNIGTTPINKFTISDELNKTYYDQDMDIEVSLENSKGATSKITLGELVNGYVYKEKLEPNESLYVNFTVTVNEKILERSNGFNIPNTANVCYKNLLVGSNKCVGDGTKTPYYNGEEPTERPSEEFVIDKWIDDSIEVGGDGDGYLSPNEKVKMHILLTNNTVDVEQFDPDGAALDIDVTDDLIDENFNYNLNAPLTVYSNTRSVDETANKYVVDYINPIVANIDSAEVDPLTVMVIDGETYEITFDTQAQSNLKSNVK